MSVSLFNKKDNIKMLWDVISDEDIFTFLTPDIQSKIYNLFLNNIQGFFDVERTKNNSLVDLNKKYILLILNHIKKTYPVQPSKIKIHNEEPLKELITFEEIQNNRKSQLEKDFSKRQEEFENLMTIKPPPLPEFGDPEWKTDKPIKEIDKILKDMQAQRNYEVEQINRTYTTSNQVDNWLKPQKTSLKTEKFQNNVDKSEQQQNYSRFKFLNELDETNITKKNVSFNNNDEVKTFISEVEEQQEQEQLEQQEQLKQQEQLEQLQQEQEDFNIFKKLKKINENKDTITLKMNASIDNESNLNEDRITKLEINVQNLNFKIDKILYLLNNKTIE